MRTTAVGSRISCLSRLAEQGGGRRKAVESNRCPQPPGPCLAPDASSSHPPGHPTLVLPYRTRGPDAAPAASSHPPLTSHPNRRTPRGHTGSPCSVPPSAGPARLSSPGGAARQPRYGRRSPCGRAGSARQSGIVVCPPSSVRRRGAGAGDAFLFFTPSRSLLLNDAWRITGTGPPPSPASPPLSFREPDPAFTPPTPRPWLQRGGRGLGPAREGRTEGRECDLPGHCRGFPRRVRLSAVPRQRDPSVLLCAGATGPWGAPRSGTRRGSGD